MKYHIVTFSDGSQFLVKTGRFRVATRKAVQYACKNFLEVEEVYPVEVL